MSIIRIANYISPKRVMFWESVSKERALRDLCALSRDSAGDLNLFTEAVFQRESVMSTGLGMGVAFPHVKIPSIPDFFVTVGIVRGEGAEWDSFDGSLVNIIFLIGGPDGQQARYLGILSKLSLVVKNPKTRDALSSASSPEEVAGLLGKY